MATGQAITVWAIEPAPVSADSGPVPKPLRFAMVHALGGVNAEDARIAIDIYWKRHLRELFPGYDSEFEILTSIPAVVKKIKTGRLHGLSLGAAQYLKLKEQVKLKPVFISSRLSRPLESYLLIVRKGADWKTLSAQPTKHLVTEKMAAPNLGRMWLETILKGRNLPQSPIYFSHISQGAKPARIVLPVFFGQADASLVPESAYDTMVELNPQISNRLTILERSPGFIKTIHCATGLLPGHIVDRFIQYGVRMDDGVDGRQLLLIFHVKKNFVYRPEFLVNSERVYRRYQAIIEGNRLLGP